MSLSDLADQIQEMVNDCCQEYHIEPCDDDCSSLVQRLVSEVRGKGHVCGYENKDDARYCGGCGVALVLTLMQEGACPLCGVNIAHHLRIGTKEVDSEGLRIDPCSVRIPR